MRGHATIEVAKTVMEVADLAWTAVECRHHHRHQLDEHDDAGNCNDTSSLLKEEELESLRSENQRLRNMLEQNTKLLLNISESPCLLEDCPPDLHARLVATVNSTDFLNQLKSIQQKSVDGTCCKYPSKEASGADLQLPEVLINIGLEEPSWWVWVTDEMFPGNVEEPSGIDNENYVIISEEEVVDGVANFMARCVLSNRKAQRLTPEELQKIITKALGEMNKLEKMFYVWHAGMLFYTLATWGFALAGLYRPRTMVRLAATGIRTTSKVVMKAL